MHCCIPTLTTDSNTSRDITLNMPSAAEESCEPSGIYIVWRVVTLSVRELVNDHVCVEYLPQ